MITSWRLGCLVSLLMAPISPALAQDAAVASNVGSENWATAQWQLVDEDIRAGRYREALDRHLHIECHRWESTREFEQFRLHDLVSAGKTPAGILFSSEDRAKKHDQELAELKKLRGE